jgi:hypothetical protein
MQRFRHIIIALATLVVPICGLHPELANATVNTGYNQFGWISPIPKEYVTSGGAYTADMRTPSFTVYRSGGWAWTQYFTIDYYVYQDGIDGWTTYDHKLTYGYISPGQTATAPLRAFAPDRARTYHFAMKVTWYTAAGSYLGATWYDYNSSSDYVLGTNVQSRGWVSGWYGVYPF